MCKIEGAASSVEEVSSIFTLRMEYVVNIEPELGVINFFNFRESNTISSEDDVESRPRSKYGYARSVFYMRVHACLDQRVEAIPKEMFS